MTKKEIPTEPLKKDPKRQIQFSSFFQTMKGTRSSIFPAYVKTQFSMKYTDKN